MNFDDTQDESAFRVEANAWIAANAIPFPKTRRRRQATPEWLEIAREWQRLKQEAGYVGIDWPKAWGGRAAGMAQAIIFAQEEAAAGLNFTFFDIGLNICFPTVASFAEQDVVDSLSPATMRGDVIWCQLFSEPLAGSDLAGIATSAVRDGDDWVINGQKVWTSGAQYSDYGLLITRSNPNVPKHRGLTMFWIDMRAPGVDVRPIYQMSEISEFNEVFLTDVRIPDSQRLGPVDAGWTTALTTLMNERVSLGDFGGPEIVDAVRLARAPVDPGGACPADQQGVRAALADHYIRAAGVVLTRSRLLTALSRGDKPGPENAIMKLVAARTMQDFARDSLLAMGPIGMIVERDEAAIEGIFQDSLTWAPGYRIAGGTDEILRTIIAERVLGMPSDLRSDKDKPFRKV